ncbi:MAG: hypothetical protein K9G49_13185 [Taibaiella sp.]|nr:hypothetical protein [Taibaiella sp.]
MKAAENGYLHIDEKQSVMKLVFMFLFSCITFTALSQSIGQSIHLPYKPYYSKAEACVGINGTVLFYLPNYLETAFKISEDGNNASRVCYIIDGVSVDSDLLLSDNYPDWGTYYFPEEIPSFPFNTIYNRTDFDIMPYYTINEIAATNPCVRQLQKGDRLNIRNGGEEGTLYVLDGVTLMR